MASLQVRDINDKRSISQEVILILEKYLSRPTAYDVNPTDEFLLLSGSWNDDRTADAIIDDMDVLIAATALSHSLALLTNNEKHFERIPGLSVENWST